jgi:hypothetical protein
MLEKGLSPNKFMAQAGLIFLKMLGWRIEGEIPDVKKFVIIAAPHTSNWDFPITLAVSFGWAKPFCSAGPLEQLAGGLEAFPSTGADPTMLSNSLFRLSGSGTN